VAASADHTDPNRVGGIIAIFELSKIVVLTGRTKRGKSRESIARFGGRPQLVKRNVFVSSRVRTAGNAPASTVHTLMSLWSVPDIKSAQSHGRLPVRGGSR